MSDLNNEENSRKRSGDDFDAPSSNKKSRSVNSDNHMLVRVLCETKWVGGVIGKSGATVKQLREISGAHITISEAAPTIHKRIVTVQGNVDVVANALHLVADKLAEIKNREFGSENKQNPDGEVAIMLLIPNCQIGGVIGKNGTKISSTRANSGANIRVSEKMLDNSTEKSVHVTGSSEQVYKALILICYHILENADKSAKQLYVPLPEAKQQQAPVINPGYNYHTNAPLPISHNPYLASPSLASSLHSPLSQYPPPSHYSPYPPVPNSLSGMAQGIGAMAGMGGVMHSIGQIGQVSGGLHLPQEKVVIPIPETLIGYIIGRNGSIINDIRTRSGAAIKISDKLPNASERTITITGTANMNEMAVALINEKLSQYTANGMPSV